MWNFIVLHKLNGRVISRWDFGEELDDNGDFSIHGAVPIKNYKIRKRVLIKNKIKKLLTFLKRKG